MDTWEIIALIAGVWIAFAAFAFWALITEMKQSRGVLTRGEVGFALYLAAHGPLAIAAAISALCESRFRGFWSKEVWRK